MDRERMTKLASHLLCFAMGAVVGTFVLYTSLWAFLGLVVLVAVIVLLVSILGRGDEGEILTRDTRRRV